MPNQPLELDRLFYALADPTRRAVLERLSSGPAAVNELAQPFDMALPSFTQHLAEQWLVRQRALWEARLNQ